MENDFNGKFPQGKDQPRYLILGWDGAAKEAAGLLLRLGSAVTVVARDLPDGIPDQARWLEGSPSDPDALRRGGIESAESVLVALPTAEARAAVVAAKRLNAATRVIASAQNSGSAPELRAAGAHQVIDARAEAAREMVRLMEASETPREGRD